MHARTGTFRWQWLLLAALSAPGGGCVSKCMNVNPPIPDASVPRELSKIVLPPYVIEPPDVLLVQVMLPPTGPAVSDYKNESRRRTDITDRPALPEPRLSPISRPFVPQPIDGQHLVGPDGTIKLGIYGSVNVAGLTREQAEDRIRQFISDVTGDRPEYFQVVVDVVAFNSKAYYVITDGAGFGEQVYSFPSTGSETVLDAVARINGLPQVASKRHIWVARRSPHGGQEQILPVDWVNMTQGGVAATNYQVLPGDRVYVMSQEIIRADNFLAKILQPIERVLGITLLGASTVHTVEGKNLSNNTGGL
jgi:polysaccharide export outer membrane protein